MTIWKRYLLCSISLLIITATAFAREAQGMISGKVISVDGEPIDFATVFLKGTSYSCSTNEKGLYHLSAPAGDYTLVFTPVGYEQGEAKMKSLALAGRKRHVWGQPVHHPGQG